MGTNKLNGNRETIPFAATHPTEIIKDEIKARGMSQKELADRMGMKKSNLSRFLRGENITPAIASKLEDALDIPADMWLKLQIQYEKDIKTISERDEREREAYATEKMLSTLLDLPVLYKRLNISISNFIQSKLEILKSHLGFNPLEIGKLPAIGKSCYKKSDKLSFDEKSQNTWLVLAYISSLAAAPNVKYVKGSAKEAAKKIAMEVHDGSLTEDRIKDILYEKGIAYSVVQKTDKTHIDAASFYVKDYPVVVTTHRYNDMSMLVFNVLHELGHIENHLLCGTDNFFISSDETYSSDNKLEKEANTFAEDILISRQTWKKMMNSGSDNISTKNIVGRLKILSKENGLDFNIVAWRYKHESKQYALSGVKSVPIR